MASAYLFQCIVKCRLRWSNQSQCHLIRLNYVQFDATKYPNGVVERSEMFDYPRAKIQRNHYVLYNIFFRWLCLYQIRWRYTSVSMVTANFVILKMSIKCHALSALSLTFGAHYFRNFYTCCAEWWQKNIRWPLWKLKCSKISKYCKRKEIEIMWRSAKALTFDIFRRY